MDTKLYWISQASHLAKNTLTHASLATLTHLTIVTSVD